MIKAVPVSDLQCVFFILIINFLFFLVVWQNYLSDRVCILTPVLVVLKNKKTFNFLKSRLKSKLNKQLKVPKCEILMSWILMIFLS